MMEIAVFAAGHKTLIGIKKERRRIELSSVNSLLLFQDPALVPERLLQTLKYCFGIDDPKEISRMYFGISGIIDSCLGEVIKSDYLDKLSLAKTYSLYSFKKMFGKIIDADDIVVLNNAQAVGLGVRKTLHAYKSAIVLLIDHGVNVSLINENGFVFETQGGTLFDPYDSRALISSVSGVAIDELLCVGTKDIFRTYTEKVLSLALQLHANSKSLNEIVAKFLPALEGNLEVGTNMHYAISALLKRIPIENVFIWSAYEEFIDKKLIDAVGFGDIIQFPANEKEKNLIPIIGCFAFPEQPERAYGYITKVEYLSKGKSVFQFYKIDDLLRHWEENYIFANPDNEYLIHYTDGFIKSKRIGDVRTISDWIDLAPWYEEFPDSKIATKKISEQLSKEGNN